MGWIHGIANIGRIKFAMPQAACRAERLRSALFIKAPEQKYRPWAVILKKNEGNYLL